MPSGELWRSGKCGSSVRTIGVTVFGTGNSFQLTPMFDKFSSGHLVHRRSRSNSQVLGCRRDPPRVSLDRARFVAVAEARGEINEPEESPDDQRHGRSEATVHVVYGKSRCGVRAPGAQRVCRSANGGASRDAVGLRDVREVFVGRSAGQLCEKATGYFVDCDGETKVISPISVDVNEATS